MIAINYSMRTTTGKVPLKQLTDQEYCYACYDCKRYLSYVNKPRIAATMRVAATTSSRTSMLALDGSRTRTPLTSREE